MVIKLKYQLQVHCCTILFDLDEKGTTLENALIAKGELKTFNKNQNTQNTSNDKNKYWAHNKNVKNDGVVDVKVIHKGGPIITLKGPNESNNPPHVLEKTTNSI